MDNFIKDNGQFFRTKITAFLCEAFECNELEKITRYPFKNHPLKKRYA
jgi:hypothetical protein